MDFSGDLETRLLRLSEGDYFTLRDAVQGVHVFGGIGSGKTSGSGKTLASAYLRAGMGGLVLCAKPDEVDRWLDYARANGRANSVVLFGERGGGFNFITYELARQGIAGLGSVIECVMRILDASRLANPNAGRGSEAFWEDNMRQLMRNTIPPLYAATGRVDLAEIIRFISTAPTSPQERSDKNWLETSFMFQTLSAAVKNPVHHLPDRDIDLIGAYWRDQFSRFDDRTRANIALSLSTALDRFIRGRLHKAFCTETTLVPEMTFHGAIIIMDMSALTWNEDGIIGQQLFKFMWQRAVLARNALDKKHRDRPVFCWADESQFFVNDGDAMFQSAARSSKACTVFLTQSLPTYYARIGGEQAKHKADMLLGNFVTKIFHNNADPETNRWAAETIGRTLHQRQNYSEGQNWGSNTGVGDGENSGWSTNSGSSFSSGKGGSTSGSSYGSGRSGGENWSRNAGRNTGGSTGGGWSEQMDYEIEPADFSRKLRTGGPVNKNNVTGVWFQAGRVFDDSRRNYLGVRFQQ